MTRESQTQNEQYFVEQAAEIMGKVWVISRNCIGPDFIVTEGTHRFGLEVTEIFVGPRNRHGSAFKRSEIIAQQKVDACRREYEETVASIPLKVQLIGDTSPENLGEIVSSLREKNLSSLTIGHEPVVIEIDKGPAKLRAHVTRALHNMWFNVKNHVGWVDCDPLQPIAEAVEEKAENLEKYLEAAGPDVRLLIYTDRHFKSGMLKLEKPIAIEMRGFESVYFLSHPESITSFDRKGNVRHFTR